MNKLFYGDNLDVLHRFTRDETVDLCYFDLPFNSRRNYNQIYNHIKINFLPSKAKIREYLTLSAVFNRGI